ncbi:MAG: DUF11 domain-containing protein [Propionibacteriaceae bacterium]|nr:DUF11 domain-containing protein [Propionibacteriaceae bacterium]
MTSAESSTTTPANRTTGLRLNKTAALNDANGDGLAQPGETITYSFAVTNSGTATLTGVAVTDPKAGTVTCPATTIAPGVTTTCTATYTVTADDMESGPHITNTATAAATGPDGSSVTSSPSSANVPTGRTSSLTLDKTAALTDGDGDGKADVGESVAYTFVITNTGNVTVDTPSITDPAASDITCVETSIAPGKTATCTGTHTVSQTDIDNGSVTNAATATAIPPIGVTPPVSPPDDTVVPADGNTALTLVKSATLNDADGDSLADAGESITYRFLVTNTGSQTLHGIAIDDAMVSDVTCGTKTLAPGASVTCTANHPVTASEIDPGTIVNQATATGVSPSNTTVTSPQDTASVPTDRHSSLAFTKTSKLNDLDGNQLADVGETVIYTFTVTNTGSVGVTDVTITDPKVADISCPTTTLAAGASVVCTATYTVTQDDLDAGILTNTATVNATPPTGVTPPPAQTGTAVVQVNVQRGGTLIKNGALNDTNGDGVAQVGETIDYTFIATNTSSITIYSAEIVDAKLKEAGITTTCDQTTLPPGAVMTCTATGYTVTQADVDAGEVSNTAYAQGNSSSGTPGVTNTATADTPASTKASQELTKEATLVDANNNSSADVGETVTYTFTATNTGDVSLHGITISDPMLSAAGSAVTCNEAATTGAAGSTVTCSASYTVTQADVDAGTIANTATATSYDPTNKAVPSNEASATVTSTRTSSLSVEKKGELNDTITVNQLADVGETIDYTFTVTNTGNVSVTAPVIDDAKLKAAGVSITCPSGTIAPTGHVDCTATYTVTQEDVDSGSVDNAATGTATPPNGVTPPTSPETTTTTPADDTGALTATKNQNLLDLDGDNKADADETITYSFVVENTGQVTITDLAIRDTKITSTGVTITCPTAPLAPGESTTCTATPYTVTQDDVDSGSVHNTATATGTTPSGSAVNSPICQVDMETDTTSAVSLLKQATIKDDDGNGLADAGETIDYTFTVTNTGNVTVRAPQISDPMLTAAGATITCPSDDIIRPKGSLDCTASYTVTQTDIDNGSVVNKATAVATTPNGGKTTPSTPESSTTTDANDTPGLTIAKTAALADANGNGTGDVNETIDYTFTLTNTGKVTLDNPTVTDEMLSTAGDAISCAPGPIAPGATLTCTASYLINQADIDRGSITNAATGGMTTPGGDRVTSPPDDSVTTVDTTSSATLTKTPSLVDANSNTLADVGENITYTFTVANTGKTTISDPSVTDAKLAAAGVTISCPTAAIPPGQSLDCTALYTVTQADVDSGSVDNVATATAKTPTGTTTTPEANAKVPAFVEPALTVLKQGELDDTDHDGLADVGELIDYTLTITNTGTVTLTDVTGHDPKLHDAVPALTVDCPKATLAPHSDMVCTAKGYTVTQEDVDSGVVHNSSTATGQPPTPTGATTPPAEVTSPPNAFDVPTDSTPELTVEKKASLNDTVVANQVADAGETIDYTFTITNSGAVTMTAPTITDKKLTDADVTITCPNEAIDPGKTLDCTATYTVTQADIDAGKVENTATATATPPTPSGSDTPPDPVTSPPDTETTTVNDEPGLTVTKKATLNDGNGNDLADLGETIAYTFTVTNTGQVTQAAPTITDGMLAGANPPVTASCPPDQIDPGKSVECTATYTVTQTDVDNGFIDNSATATSTTPSGDPITSPPSETTTTTERTATMTVDKQATLNDGDGDNKADPGETIDYTFTISNTGDVTLTKPTLTDPMLTKAGVTLDCPDDPILPGKSAQCTATYTVTQADIDAGTIANEVTATATPPEGVTPPTATDTVTTTTDTRNGIQITKSSQLHDTVTANELADLGETITFTFTATNTGTTTIHGVLIDDPLLDDADPAIAITCPTDDSIAPGKTLVCTADYTVTQADVNRGYVRNVATMSATDPDGNPVPPESQGSTTEVPADFEGGLVVTKTSELKDSAADGGDGDGYADKGETIDYTFTLRNTGTVTLTNLAVTDTKLTAGTNPVTITCPDATYELQPGGKATCTASYVVTQDDVDAGNVANEATATAKTPPTDTNPDGETVTSPPSQNTVTTDRTPKLTLAKTAAIASDNGNNEADLNETIDYTITATNAGTVTLTGLTISDPMLAGLDPAVTVTCPVTTLEPGDSTDCTASYKVVQGDIDAGKIVNTATATANDPDTTDGPTTSNEATVTTPVYIDSGLSLEKSALPSDNNGNDLADVGETILYTFVIHNTGTVTITQPTITDPKVGAVECLSTVIQPGGKATCHATYTITQADIDNGIIHNVATASGKDPTGTMVTSDPATHDEPTNTTSALTVDKQAKLNDTIVVNGAADVGETIRYTMTAKNTGTTTMRLITANDDMLTTAGVTVTCPTAPLLPGDTLTCAGTYTVTQADIDAGAVNNAATVTGTGPGGTTTVTSPPDETVTIVNNTPAMTLDKKADLADTDKDGKADAGEVINYTFTVTNTGTVTINGDVAISDTKLGSGAVTCPTTTIAPGGKLTCTATYTVTQQDVDSGQVANTATATATSTAGDVPPATGQTTTTTDTTSAIDLTKDAALNDADGDGKADVGETITYTITIKNTGNVTVSAPKVTDAMLTAAGVNVTFPADPIAPGESASATYTYTVTQPDVDAGKITNAATAFAVTPPTVDNPGGGITPNTDGDVTTTADDTPALTLTKTGALIGAGDADGDGLADAGDVLTYTFVLTNTGNVTVTNPHIDDPMLTKAGVSVTCPATTTLAPTDKITCTAAYTVTQADIDAGAITNAATGTATTPGGDTVPPAPATVTTTPDVTPSVTVDKQATLDDHDGDGKADAGEMIRYVFTVKNTGTTTLRGATITDPALTAAGVTVSCPATVLAPGDSLTCSAAHTVSQTEVDAGSVANSATAKANPPTGDPVTSPPSDTTRTTDQTPKIALTKKAELHDLDGDHLADAGESITYTFTVINSGTVTASAITIDDPMLTADGATAPCSPDSIAPGEAATCSAVHVVTQEQIDAGVVANTATAHASTPAGPASSTSTATVDVDDHSSLTMAKAALLADADGDQLADAGETIDYTFTVTNTGMVTVTAPAIRDPKLAGAGVTPTCPVSTIAPGDHIECTATYTVTQADVDRGSVDNSATATATPPSGPPVGSPTDTTKTPTDVTSGLTVVKKADLNDLDGDGLADVGERIDYTFTVTNSGMVTITAPAISDPKLAAAGMSVTCPADPITPKGTATCTAHYTVTQADVDAGQVANSATATGTTPDGGTTPPSSPSTATTPSDSTSSLTVDKTATLNDLDFDKLADVGETIAYTFIVTNTGTVSVTAPTIDDKLLSDAGVTVTCPSGLILPGGTARCTATYTVTQADVDAGTVHNEATATATPPGGITPAITPPTSPPDTTDTPSDQTASATVVKKATLNDVDGDGLADAGETIAYTFTVTNTGMVSLATVTIDDAMLTAAGVTPTCPAGQLAPGAKAECTATYTVTQADIDAGKVANSATATVTPPSGTPITTPPSETTTTVDDNPSLSVDKTGTLNDGDGDGLADVGETIDYVFTITNTGGVTVSAPAIDDPKLTAAGATVTCPADPIDPGATARCTATYTVTQADVDAGSVANSATATGKTPDGSDVPPSTPGTTTTPSDASSGLTLVKKATLNDGNANALADAGETIDYTFTITNTGMVTMTAPGIDDAKLADAGVTISCPTDPIAPGASVDCTASYTVTQADVDAGVVRNEATATATPPTPSGSGGTPPAPVTSPPDDVETPANDTDGATMVKTATITNDDGDGLADAGETIQYTFTITNTGSVTLSDLTVADPMLARSAITAACPTAALPPGQSAVCTASYTVTQADVDAGSIANTATASGKTPGGDPVPTPETTETTGSDTTPGLSVVKTSTLDDTDGNGKADVGEKLTYTVTVTNTGEVTMSGITVSDPTLEAAGSTVTCPVSGLAPGDSTACTASYTVTQADLDRGTIVNNATASGKTPGGDDITSPPGSDTVTPNSTPGYSFTKQASLNDRDGDGLADAGETISYSFVFTNTGEVTLGQLTVSDEMVGTVTCPAGDLAPGDSVTCVAQPYRITDADVEAGGVSNTASGVAHTPDTVACTGDMSYVRMDQMLARAALTGDRSALARAFTSECPPVPSTVTTTTDVPPEPTPDPNHHGPIINDDTGGDTPTPPSGDTTGGGSDGDYTVHVDNGTSYSYGGGGSFGTSYSYGGSGGSFGTSYSTGGSVPNTGSPVGRALIIAALVALAGGAVLLVVSRRRRKDE